MSTPTSTAVTGNRRVVRTACTLDCPDGCTMDVTVEDGVIVDIEAATLGDINTLTDGFICRKVKLSPKRVHSPDRIRTPLIRVGPKGTSQFRQASWDEALDLVAERIRQSIDARGVDSVIPYLYNSSSGLLESAGAMVELFARLGCPEVEHTICAATYGAAWAQMYRGMESVNPHHIPDARLLVVWGANPNASNSHLVPLITEFKKRGGTLVVVDPRRIGVADGADLHLHIRPGTDAALALAVTAELERRGAHDATFLEKHALGSSEFLATARSWKLDDAAHECGLDVADIVRFVDLVASIRPAILRPGYGIERNHNGGSGMLAVLGLWAVAGNFGVRGSGVLVSTSRTSAAVVAKHFPDVNVPRTTMNMNHIGRIVRGESNDHSKPSVLVIQGANPVVTAVDQKGMIRALEQDDVFTVVHEQVHTDTTAYADVVLPATSQFEVDDVATSYGSFALQRVSKVIDPVGESRGNHQLGFELAARLGVPLSTPLSIDVPALTMVRDENGPIQFATTFPTEQVVMLHDEASELPLPAPRRVSVDARFPLALITPASSKATNSMFAEYDPPEPVVRLHPTDASVRGIFDGDDVSVVSALGVIDIVCAVDDRMKVGVCEIPKGLWRRHTRNGLVSNAVVPDLVNDLAGGACFNDGRVQVERRPNSAHSNSVSA